MPARLEGVVPRTIALIALATVLLWIAIRAVQRGHGDVKGYIVVGGAVLDGLSPYEDIAEARKHWPPGNVWPPAFAVAVTPLSLVARVSPLLARSLWQAGNLAALWWTLSLLARLVHRRRLTLDPRGTGLLPVSLPMLVPLVLAAEFVEGNLIYIQVDMMLFALVLQGLAWHANGRLVRGGIAIGAAAALKVVAVVFIPYLLWRRQWRTAAWALGALVLISLSPILVRGPAGFAADVRGWLRAVGEGWGPGPMNQSLVAFWDRFLGYGWVPFVTPPQEVPTMSGSLLVQAAVWATRGIVAVLALWLFRGRMPPDGRTALAEWGVVFIVGAVFGPVAKKHALVVLLLPWALLTSLATDGRCSRPVRRTAAALLVVAFLLALVPSSDIVGRRISLDLHMAGTYTLAALSTLFGLFWLRRRLPGEPQHSSYGPAPRSYQAVSPA